MAIDLKNLSQSQLNELIQRAEQRRSEITTEKASKLREKLIKLAEAEGFTVAELFGFHRAKKGNVVVRKRRAAKPKYRNPSDPAQIWSGRGKRPHWFSAALAAGKKEKDLLIA